jgi:hypothetical protein
VTAIEVKGTSREISLQRKEEGWTISGTDNFIADPQLVTTALDTIANFTRDNIASKNPEKQDIFEVTDDKGLEVKAVDADQKTIAHFFVGKSGPDFFSTYLRKEGSNEVVLARGSIKSTFDKSPENWRDKTIFNFSPETVTQLTLTTPEEETVLLKDEKNEWYITSPEQIKAKKDEVENIISTLATLRAIEFAEDVVLENYQLDKPLTTITAILKDQIEKKLLIGKKHEDRSQYYVKNQAKDPVYLIGTYQVDKMRMTFNDLKEEEVKEQDSTESEPESPLPAEASEEK